MKRKRAYVPLVEKLAATLVCLLSQEQRDDLRSRKPPAKQVVSLFEFDHVILHCHGGADKWHNLTPMEKAPHREKSKRDTSIAAKVVRVDDKWNKFVAAMAKGSKPPKPKSAWPKRKFNTRRRNGA